jgi:hypothetical protein
MKQFVLSVTSPPTIAKLANEVAAIIDERVRLVDILRTQHLTIFVQMQPVSSILPPLDPSDTIPTVADMTPRDIAECLTWVEGDLYSQILPADYIVQALTPSVANKVEAASAMNNKIGYWVKRSILYSDQLESRGRLFKYFVEIAQVRYPL